MKLQLTEQSIRLRLSGGEVQQFAQAGALRQELVLGPAQVLRYALVQLPERVDATAPRVRYVPGELVVEVPAGLARQLAEGATVSLRGELAVPGGRPVSILVEQDLGPSH